MGDSPGLSSHNPALRISFYLVQLLIFKLSTDAAGHRLTSLGTLSNNTLAQLQYPCSCVFHL